MARWVRQHYPLLVLLAVVEMGWSQTDWHFTGNNIAKQKTTEQRPGTKTVGFDFIPSSGLAVDGNRNPDFWKKSCSHTTGGLNTTCYWSVDLGNTYFVKGIRIYHRDSFRDALDNFNIVGYPSETTLHDDATAETKLSRKAKIDIPVPATKFSNITITRPAIPNRDYPLILCEVEIYGVLELNFCSSENTDDQLIWTVSSGFRDSERNLVVEESIIEFSCPPYYTLSGAASVTCLSTGNFNVNIPRCLETPCKAPSTIPNGEYSATLKIEYSYYETVTWECSEGHGSTQNRTRQCRPTSEWSGSDPVCTLIECTYPSGLTNGELMYQNDTKYSNGNVNGGIIITVSCDECFTSNTETIHCTQDQTWSTTPRCTNVECAIIGTFTGGHYIYNKGAMQGNHVCGTVATVSCNTNFKKTFDTRTCGQDGSWSGSDTQPCERICTSPPEIAHGSYNEALETYYSVGDTLKWDCLEGYKSDQNRTRQCLDTSSWSGTGPTCTLITCPFPSTTGEVSLTLDDGSAYIDGHISSRSVVNINCDDCFEFNVASITCGLDEEWDNVPTCSRIECNSLGSLFYTYTDKDGNALNNTGRTYGCGTVVEINCGANYNQTADTLTCGEHGDSSWSGKNSPCVNLLSGPDTGTTSGPPIPIIGGAVAAVVVVGAVTGVLVFLLLRRRKRASKERHKGPLFTHPRGHNNSVVFTNLQDEPKAMAASDDNNAAVSRSAVKEKEQTKDTEYEQPVTGVEGRHPDKLDLNKEDLQPDPRTDEINDVVTSSAVKEEEQIGESEYEQPDTAVEDENDTYYSFGDGSKIPPRAIKLSDLTQLVLFTESTEARLKQEFKTFPVGMVKPHTRALQLRSRNRYRELFAYDDTRVVLSVWDPRDTDYINACYIYGLNEPKAYIACQGPVNKIMNDFWRMMWQTNSGKIVMLTNLNEAGKMKCEQYWPESGTEVYGPIRVTLESTDAFSNFVIRNFLVEKEGEPQRRVKQFHFTAWPDKDVPSFCSSLVHFRYKVKAATGVANGPIVVHCSAGVGRTGTYIAIDYLVDQAKELDYVDVAGCVEALRQQRVDMVQKEKQYVFVHKAVIEILELKTSDVPTSNFVDSYSALMHSAGGKRKIDAEFDMLWKLGPKRKPAEENGDKAKEAKSRFSAYYTDEEFMPSISGPGLGQFGEYINATFLPMYRDADALIITQTPLVSTMEDFWNLVYHQQVHTIVMMNNKTQIKPNETYWPSAQQTVKYGDNTISNKGARQKDGHMVLHLTLTSAGMARQIKLVQYGKWVDGSQLPDGPKHMLSALEIVQESQRQTGNHPMLVHCMDGVERSGLFCVIAATLDRTKIEQDVAISQIIQEMRNRRPNVIPNAEQFQFCHDVVTTFLDNFETYSNFAFDVHNKAQ